MTVCENPRCRRKFRQPNDPGRRRRFCSNACRQASYRDRTQATKNS